MNSLPSKVFLILLLIAFGCLGAIGAYAQKFEIPGVRVLESTEAFIEGLLEKNSEGSYLWQGRGVFFEFAEERCGDHGWDVAEGTVLSYGVSFPKETLLSSFRRWDPKDSVRFHDGSYILDETEGIKIAITPVAGSNFEDGKDNAFVDSISFNPKPNDEFRRCPGYPEYRLGNELHYEDDVYGTLPIEDMVARSQMTLARLQNRPGISAVLIIYLSTGTDLDQLRKYDHLREVIRNEASKMRIDQDRIKFIFGGYNRGEMTYHYFYFSDDKPPLPTPNAPCFDPRCYKEIK